MSAEGAPVIDVDGTGLNITVVAASWHKQIMDGLVNGAEDALLASGATFQIVRVPGSFELPVVAKAALDAGADGVVALGVVIRGGTPHFDYVCEAATDGLTNVAIATGKPVGFGVLTLDDEQQGLDRAGLPGSKESKGDEAARAVIATARAIAALHNLA